MHFIEHIVEPTKLLLAWQSSDESHRTRYLVGELERLGEEIRLIYRTDSQDFDKAVNKGFTPYPAFPDPKEPYSNVLDAFMRRLPPRSRGDFPQYLERLRLKPDVQISDFGLLGYSGAKLLSDGYSIIHPFYDVAGPCELLLEAAGYRHIAEKPAIKIGDPAVFVIEACHEITQEEAIRIEIQGNKIGYVNRGLIKTFLDWINNNRITGAWVEKINGTPGRPALYLFVTIKSNTDI